MKQLAQDFLDESRALHGIVRALPEAELDQETAFKRWSITDVLRHLHIWNIAAGKSLKADGSFEAYAADVTRHLATNASLSEFERTWMGDLTGPALVSAWIETAEQVADQFATADPAARVAWVGPGMSVRSSMTARLMETWAHGQEVYDVLDRERVSADRIRSIVVLGNNTYGWTFKVRGQTPVEPRPHLKLTAPSGEVWLYNDPVDGELIEGLAEEFCQVVTQTRNIADTGLVTTGPNAANWMANAQCFAGAAQPPPPPGTRQRRRKPAT